MLKNQPKLATDPKIRRELLVYGVYRIRYCFNSADARASELFRVFHRAYIQGILDVDNCWLAIDQYEYYRSIYMAWKMVNIRLGTEHKKDFEAFAKKHDLSFLDVCMDIAELGYKGSFSYVDRQNSYIFSISGTKDSTYNQDRTISSWSKDLDEAAMIGLFKITELCQNGKWEDYEQETSNWG